jgi:Rrf2 family protein
MITREADYAIRALLSLAREDDKTRFVSTRELAEKNEIPHRFLRKIVKKLVEGGLVVSKKGSSGGLLLARPAGEITLLQAVTAMGKTCAKLNSCLGEEEKCSRDDFCPVHDQLKKIQQTLDAQLNFITFAQLAKE